jgi:acetyl coenzyme A synthetase (ADP forming)-like protein
LIGINFFRPESVAIIGASANPAKLGFSILKNIIDGGFPRKIYPVNLTEESILGLKVYPKVTEISRKVDLAVVVVPREAVLEVIKEIGEAEIPYAVIITSGYAETGEAGKYYQRELVAVAKEFNVRILGPNCLGVISCPNKLNASFAMNMPEKKNIGVISQSGATCTAILDWANGQGIGFSHFVSLGNKADLNEIDFLEFLAEDDQTEVVIGYLESVSDGEALIEVAKRLTKKKPFILLKAGVSKEGQKAARSHTAALAADDRVLDEALRESGVIRADDLQDLFEWATTFANLAKPKNTEIMIIGNAGGPTVMAVDGINLEDSLDLYRLTEKEAKNLNEVLPDRINIVNPLDLQGDATSREFRHALTNLKKDIPKLIVLTPQTSTDAEKIASVISEEPDRLTVVNLIGGQKFEQARKILAAKRIPVFLYPERAVRALGKLGEYAAYKKNDKKNGRYIHGFKRAAEQIIGNKTNLNDTEVAKLLAAYKIPMADSRMTSNAMEAVVAAERIGYPVVLKIASKDILHKTEGGVVKVGIENETTLRNSYQEILRNAKKNYPDAEISGITVYRMVRSSVEVAIGAKRDPVFGPTVMFGLGGIYIEVFKDFNIRLCPVSISEAKEMIKKIKSYRLLDGYRNGEKYDLEHLAEAISGLSQMMLDLPEIAEVDVNPIRFSGKNILALDAKVIFEKQ